MENAELVRSAFAAFLRGDLDALREAMDPEAQWLWYEPGPWDCHGREAVLDRLGQRVGAITGLDGVVAGGELVALEASGPELAAHLVITLRDGRIVRLEDHRSRADALVAAGAAPRPAHVPTRVERPEPGWDAVHDLVPFVHATDLRASVAFYERLGFAVRHRWPEGDDYTWAWLDNDRARIMLVQADAPIDDRVQGVLFYLYARDLFGLRDRLVAAGVQAGEIVDGSPGPRTEMRVRDPDGYVLMIAQLDPDATSA